MNKGQALAELGRREDAITVFQYAIVLNPGDNLGLHWILLPLLLSRGLKNHLDSASKLITQYEDDASGAFLWTRVLYLAVTKASFQEIQSMISRAISANRLIAVFLENSKITDLDDLAKQATAYELDEAFSYYSIAGYAWARQPDAWQLVKKLLLLEKKHTVH